MTTLTPTWTENQTVTMSNNPPADTVTSSGTIDLDAGGYDRALLQITMVIPAGASDYLDVNIKGSADSGTTVDTVPLYNRRVDAVASSTITISQVIDGVPHVTVDVENQCNVTLTTLTVKYAGRQWITV